MAVNRFMKPADQPLLNTHVKLPFQEMSMAYATKQKEHNDAEDLAGTLDDEILKLKASSPEHSEYLSQYRTGLTTELSDLYDKHQGRYADMVPSLKRIKNRTDLEFSSGNLGVIKSSTKQTQKLQKKISEARDDEKYDDQFNPYLGSEGNWQGWFKTGTEGGQDDAGAWNLSESSRGIYGTEGGRLKPFDYTGLHPHVDELKEANENIFKYIKPDIDKQKTQYKSGVTITNGQKQITLSKLYQAAHKNKQFLSGGFKNELDYVVTNRMDDETILGAANNAINNMFGSDEYIASQYGDNPNDEQLAAIEGQLANKQEIISELQDDNGITDQAKSLAETNYIGAMGEKFMMSDLYGEVSWDQAQIDKQKNKGRAPQSDWVPVIAGTTPVVSLARPTKLEDPSTFIQDGGQPLQDFNTLVVDKKKNFERILNEFELLKSQGTMDEEMTTTKQDEIDRAKYAYQAAAFSQKNLLQSTAVDMGIQREGGSFGPIITYIEDGVRKSVAVDSPRFKNEGWSNIEFNDDGTPVNMGDWDGQESLTTQHLGYDYSEGFISFLNNAQGSLTNALNNKIQTFGEQGWYGGRSAKLPTWNTSLSKSLDNDVTKAMQSNFIKDDYEFTNNTGSGTSLNSLLNDEIIKQDVIDEFIIDDDLPIVWTTVPDPSTGNYKGMISIPTEGAEADNTTMTLYFDAPSELKQSWVSLTEDYDSEGLKYTRATTPVEKMVFNNNFLAQMDIQSAATINGNVAPSSHLDGDGRVLGMYYFNRTPDGDPILNSEFLFRPQAGLVSSINPDGEYNYTTGDELFPTDIDASSLSQLIALNDPKQSGSLEFWKKTLSEELPTGNYPIAVQNSPVTETSEAREVDVTGMPYSTRLSEGQTSYSGDRMQANNFWGATNKGLLGTNINFANQVQASDIKFGENSNKVIDNIATDFETTYKDVPVMLSDGTETTLLAAMNNGDLKLEWASQSGSGAASIPINNSNRSYQEQLDKYTAYVDGGKTGDPIANPNIGGFHVMGQAIDLSQTKGNYDLILVTGDGISSVGGSNVNPFSLSDTGAGTKVSASGVSVSQLKNNGKLIYPNFLTERLDAVFNSLGSPTGYESDFSKVMGKAPIRQFDKEWWHWSAGEFRTETPAVYPSW